METYETICTLCLKTCESFKAIEENIKDVLDKLVPKIDLTAIQEPVACTKCEDMLIKCFGFKAACLCTHGYIVSFISNTDNVKLDLKDVYRSKNENSIVEDQEICGFCLGSVKNCLVISINDEKVDVMLEKMIKQCLPELDLKIIQKPVICVPCYESLENLFSFVMNCLTVEEKIKKYCETLDINIKGQVEISSLLQFTINEVDDSIGMIKVEKQVCEEGEIGNGGDIFNPMFWNGSENAKAEVEYKSQSFMDMDDMKFYNEGQFTSNNMLACKEESNNLDVIKTEEGFYGESELKKENVAEVQDQTRLFNEEIEIKTNEPDCIRLEDSDILRQQEVTSRLHRKQKCLVPNFEADASKSYNERTLPKKNVSTGTTYRCASCSFQTKYKQCLKTHVLKRCQVETKVTMYKCDSCSFQTKHKGNLKTHLLTHKNLTEVTVYECDSCSFQTKHKDSLRTHLLMHKDPSEVKMYKCHSCLYQTKHKNDLKKHLLKHKDPSEVTLYKCDSCSFQTKHKDSLKIHLLRHKDPSEVTMYKCSTCSFQTKHKCNLKDHLLGHKNPSEVAMYKCDFCVFQTKHKYSIKLHLLKHKDPSEVTVYKCEACLYQTKHKGNHKTHLLTHKNPTEVTMYKCDSCLYQTKHKGNLKNHLLTHNNPTEVAIYKCDFCLYQTKFKCSIKKHLIIHKNPSEVTMYKCDFCLYQTKHKGNLNNHLLTHKDPTEVTMYKCESCLYHTKHKCSIKRHLLRHKILHK